KDLKIMGYPVELYVQNVDEMPESGGIYDLEENAWLRKPKYDDIKSIGLDKFTIKDKAAMIMTIIDDMWHALKTTDDMYDVRQLDDDASDLWKKVKDMRKSSLEKHGESGAGNIIYKVMRRMGYLDKLFDLRSAIYDKLNSISEATHKFKVLMIETLDENKELLKEYLDNDYGLPLYKYFKWAEKATDKEKVQDLFWHNPYIIEKYLEDVSDYDEELKELQDELYNDEDLKYDEEFIDRVINALERNNLLSGVIENVYEYAYAEELPTWMTMDFIRLVENEWCIHFTSDAYNIAREGFTGGTPEIDDLAYTGAGRQKIGAGYDFAFLIHDRSVDFNGYGDEAVIFRASGVLARHYGDEQDQVIFWGPSVKEIIPIKTSEYSGDWEIEGLNGQIFKKAEKPSELADWATDNLPQYRNQILAGKSGYQPWGFSRPKYYNESVNKAESEINEEIVADGNAEHNPYEKRWKAERQALKDFLVNCGKIMTSKENGKQYKVYYDQTISNLIG
ncbi:hypothetical protein, partial [Sharpea azabuensis]|uniref:hypothetical protein n=1 Tax=Sharpea azabuensis TaxID=322505 RepID=UPI002E81E7B2